MKKGNIKKAKKHLTRLRELVAQGENPFKGMSEDEVIQAMRKRREKIWEKKLATRS